MNIETLLKTRGIDWQGVEPYETNAGKEKLALIGIPIDGGDFWRAWKHDKASVRAIVGFQLKVDFETVSATRSTSTGQESRAGGGYRQGTRTKKSFTIRVNVNKYTRATIRQSFPIPGEHDARTVEAMQPGGADVDQPF